MNMPQKPDNNDDPITRPAHDEWGVYDPEQAGFEAILKKLSTKKKAVPDQARPVQAPAPAAHRRATTAHGHREACPRSSRAPRRRARASRRWRPAKTWLTLTACPRVSHPSPEGSRDHDR